jgi:hypothetical protein
MQISEGVGAPRLLRRARKSSVQQKQHVLLAPLRHVDGKFVKLCHMVTRRALKITNIHAEGAPVHQVKMSP